MMNEKIEILMAVYNGEKFVEEQINSILNQTYSQLHLIIRDNSSEDNTVKIIEKMIHSNPGRITLLISPTNVGVIGNFGALMHSAKAKYVMFSDADDVWHSDKVSRTFTKFKELENAYGNKKPLLVHTDLTVVNRQLDSIHHSFWQYSNLDPINGHSLNRLLVQHLITGCTVMVNRPLLDLAIPVPEQVVMHDWWLGLIASAFGHIGIVDAPTLLYRQHGSNDTGAKKYGIASCLKRFLNAKAREKASNNIQRRYKQAQVLFERHKDLLSPQQKDLITGFLKSEKASFFNKFYLKRKYGLFRQGFWRNLSDFLPLK